MILLSKAITTKAQVNVNDSLVLVNLYNSTDGPSWNNHSNWLTGPVKNWYGIYLTDDNSRVIQIFMPQNNLNGTIPSALGNLSNLIGLVLDQNQLSGSIPPELGNLSNLSTLSLSDNHLGGTIPISIGNLINLTYLNLIHNKLSGTIPASIDNLVNLTDLYLAYNKLSGIIPASIDNLGKLRWLNLSNNRLSGSIPASIGNLVNLQLLILSYNQLSGSIPASIGNLISLDYAVDLSNNQLNGSIPSSIGNLVYLPELNLSHNKLSNEIPSSLVNLSNLYLLDLSYNQFTFAGMESVAQTFPFIKYNWQAPIPVRINNNVLTVSAGGTLSNNTYSWYKAGKPGNTTIKGDSVFNPTESGVYFVRVINKVVKNLNLVSKPIKYTASVNAVSSNKQEVLSNSFSVYPNPAKDILHITTNGNASFSLMSENGKVLINKKFDKTGAINISNIAAGVYYLKNNSTNASQKVLIVR